MHRSFHVHPLRPFVFHPLVRHLLGRHFITVCASSSNVCLIVMRDRRISGYSFKNYSYFLCAFKRFGDLAIRDLSIRAIQHRYFKYRHFLTFSPKIQYFVFRYCRVSTFGQEYRTSDTAH